MGQGLMAVGVGPDYAVELLGRSLGLQGPQLSNEHMQIHLRAAAIRRGKIHEALSTMSGAQ